jgi:perosamine synthetase
MVDFIPVNEPLLDGNEAVYLKECIDTGWISSEGPFVERFERGIAKLTGRKHAIAVSNGTAAIDIAVECLGIKAGDEIILPTFTIISCLHQIVRLGAVPVLVDCDPLTWNMDVSKIENRITNKTKAIMAVHIYGLPVDMDPLIKIAKKYSLKIIEDAAEMIGQTYNNLPCGSFGDVSTLSFYPNKHVTTGEGGMVLTDNDDLAENCRKLRNLCFVADKRFVHERLGWNYRMTNLQAAVGVAQLERIDEFVLKKREIGKFYNDAFESIDSISLPLVKTSYAENIYWVFGIVIKDTCKINAKSAMAQLNSKGIGTRPFFFPMHRQPVLNQMGLFEDEIYPNSEKMYSNGFYVPSGLKLDIRQMTSVVNNVKSVFKNS